MAAPEDAALLSEREEPDTSTRPRRPIPERTHANRGWDRLYAIGVDADAVHGAVPIMVRKQDDRDRIVEEAGRALEENLRRGREMASELAGSSLPSATVGKRLQFATVVSRALVDPALGRGLVRAVRGWFRAGGELGRSPRHTRARAPHPRSDAPLPLHPQERADYQASGGPSHTSGDGPRLLRLSLLRPGEWVGDASIGGRVRRVHVRELEES